MEYIGTVKVGDKELVFEAGRLAKQASGSVKVTCGGTVVLATACSSDEQTENLDFAAFTVDYQERTYSAGKIPKLAPWEFLVPKMKKGCKWETTVGEMHLINTGDTFLRVAEVIGAKTTPEYESVYLFHVTSRSWLALALLAGILAGALSILGSWLSNCFF